MKTLGIAIALFLFGLDAKSDEDSRKFFREHYGKVLNAEWPPIVAAWKPVSIGAVDLAEYSSLDLAEYSSGDTVPLLGKVSLNRESQKQLQSLLVSEAVPNDSTRSCFFPRHTIVFQKGQKTFTLLICFQCNEIKILGAAPDGDWQHALHHFSNELRGYLNGQLDAGGVKRTLKKETGEQDGAEQPATAPESKPEGNEKPKPESEVRPQ